MKLKVFISTALLLFGLVGSAFANSEVPHEVKEAADQGLRLYKEKIKSQPEEFGYKESEVDSAELEEGYQVNIINTDKLKKSNSESLLDNSAPLDRWEFVVSVNGSAKSFLTVAKVDGAYKTVKFGGNAEQFGEAEEKIGKKDTKLVKFESSYFLVDKQSANEVVVPALTLDGKTVKKQASDIVKQIKEAEKNKEARGSAGVGEDNNIHPVVVFATLSALGIFLAFFLRKRIFS